MEVTVAVQSGTFSLGNSSPNIGRNAFRHLRLARTALMSQIDAMMHLPCLGLGSLAKLLRPKKRRVHVLRYFDKYGKF